MGKADKERMGQDMKYVIDSKTYENHTRALNAHKALCAAPISMGRGEIPVELRPKEVPLAASSRPFCLFHCYFYERGFYHAR